MNKFIFIIDVQKDFIDGSLAVKGADKIIPNIVEKLNSTEYSAKFLTADFHPFNHSSFKKNGGIWPIHCVEHTEGAAINTEVMIAASMTKGFTKVLTKGDIPEKEEYSVFDNPYNSIYIQNILSLTNVDEIQICGISGEFCVLSTIKDLVKLGYGDKIVVLNNCVASIDGGKTLVDYCDNNRIKIKM